MDTKDGNLEPLAFKKKGAEIGACGGCGQVKAKAELKPLCAICRAVAQAQAKAISRRMGLS